MKPTKKHGTTLYIIIGITLLISMTSLVLPLLNSTEIDRTEWRCGVAECTEYVDISGEEWARENCEITAQGTICLAVFDDGRQFQIPLEEINLSAIEATKCANYVCVEETPYRQVNYDISIENLI